MPAVIHDPAAETMPRPELRALQSARLEKLARYVYERVHRLPRGVRRAGVGPAYGRSLDDLRRLPFTQQERPARPLSVRLFAVPQSEVVRVHASSGTTGKPTVVGYTRADVELFAEVNARSSPWPARSPG